MTTHDTQKWVLIGMRGAGKTSVGIQLAASLHIPFYDLDALIETALQQPIKTFFDTQGEQNFRNVEYQQLVNVLQKPAPFVLATGGGVVEFPDSMDLLSKEGICIHIQCSAETLFKRLDNSDRPRLTNHNLQQEIHYILNRRLPKYQTLASFTCDTTHSSAAECVEQLRLALG